MAFVSFGAAYCILEITNHLGHLLSVVSFYTAFEISICLVKFSKLETTFVGHHVLFAPPQKTFSLA